MKTLAALISALSLVLFSIEVRGASLQFDHSENQQIPAFFNAPSNPYLTAMRKEFALESLVTNKTSDIERILSVARWVRSRWNHNGSNTPEKHDPISVLREAATGKEFRCVEYAVVLSGALNALGYPSRVLGLMTIDVETRPVGAGHVVSEVYVPDLKKWVMVDGQWNVVPLVSGLPANAVELAEALATRPKTVDMASFSGDDHSQYVSWIEPYLYFFTASIDNTYDGEHSNGAVRLAPMGATEPTVFQLKYPMQHALFTHNVTSFYPVPTIVSPAEAQPIIPPDLSRQAAPGR